MIVAAVCYKQGVPFQEEYYFASHMPLADRVLKPLGLQRAEVRKVTGTADGTASPYQVITSLYFPSLEAFQAAMQHPSVTEVLEDIPNFYGGQPDILIGQVAWP